MSQGQGGVIKMQEKESHLFSNIDFPWTIYIPLFLAFFKNLYFTNQEHQMEIFQNVPNK